MTPLRAPHRSLLVAALFAVAPAAAAFAQCPDGTPPPCRGLTSAAARRPAPPLDANTWIIVPFENVTHVPDIDWLKDASVNLLYLDMSKWRDIRVIDDERVADYIREVPEARSGTLTLQGGIAVARRAGAGKLVMGDVLKVGSRTQLVAKVFDVRTGQRVRTVRQDALNADSIMPAFGLLARGVLALEPPSGTALGAIGTTRLDAYQAYLDGVRALNAFDLPTAHARFDHAIALDSSFALAHYKLTIVIGWEAAASTEHLHHAQAAARLSAGLPVRERTLIAGLLAQAQSDYGRACEIYSPMVRDDSNDVELLYNWGECNYHDLAILVGAGDSSVGTFRSSWNTSLRAFRRVLLLDPTYHLAFQHVQDALLATGRPGCLIPPGATVCGATNSWAAYLQRAGDSLVTVPINLQRNPAAYEERALEARRSRARGHNLEEARVAALEWLQSGEGEMRPRIAYGRILLRLGRVAQADSIFATVTGRRARTEQGTFVSDRVEADIKLGRAVEAIALFDSLAAAFDTISGARNQFVIGGGIFGRPLPIDTLIDRSVGGSAPVVARYFKSVSRMMIGAPADSLVADEQGFASLLGAAQGPARTLTLLLPSLAFTGLEARAGRWPAVTDTASADPRVRLASVLATRDTARYRAAIARFDSLSATLTDEPDGGFALLGADAHLFVGDTAGALASLRRFRDVSWPRTPLFEQLGPGFAFSGWLWGRTMLLLGDLAAARGQADEARAAYRLVLGLWAHADPELQPTVERVRAALARLGG